MSNLKDIFSLQEINEGTWNPFQPDSPRLFTVVLDNVCHTWLHSSETRPYGTPRNAYRYLNGDLYDVGIYIWHCKSTTTAILAWKEYLEFESETS